MTCDVAQPKRVAIAKATAIVEVLSKRVLNIVRILAVES
jgi:hypothetical protein